LRMYLFFWQNLVEKGNTKNIDLTFITMPWEG
jgi:hypothetical protein